MKNANCSWLVGACLAFVVSGCGGTAEDEAASCGDTSQCGGDIVGNWKISSTCLSLEGASLADTMGCAGITSEGKDLAMSGTVSYNADKTYQANVTVTGSVVATVPAACLTQQSVTLTCSQLQQGLEASSAESGYQSVVCSGSSSCSCTMKLVPAVQATRGTYSTAGGTLTETAAGGTPDDSSYCVKGKSLTVSPTGSMSSVAGSVVLSKQ